MVARKSSPRSSSSGNSLAIRCAGINASPADVWVQEASLSFTLGHCLRSREWQQEQWPRNVPSPPANPGPSLRGVQLTVAFQRPCTSAPAAPLLSSGLARGNSEKPALEAYLQDTKHGSVSPGCAAPLPSPARCRRHEQEEPAAPRVPPGSVLPGKGSCCPAHPRARSS